MNPAEDPSIIPPNVPPIAHMMGGASFDSPISLPIGELLSPRIFERATPERSVPRLITTGMDLSEKVAWIGIGLGPKGVPIDLVTLYLAGLEAKAYTILVVDELQRVNGMSDINIDLSRERLLKTLKALGTIYDYHPNVLLASSFMSSEAYKKVLAQTYAVVETPELQAALLGCVPRKFRERVDALTYPVHEIALTEYLRTEKGVGVKVGPEREVIYDSIMERLGMSMKFAYLINALSFGGKRPDSVVHYIPGHVGASHQRRILLNHSAEAARAIIELGPDESLRYLLRVASVAGARLGRLFVPEEETELYFGPTLARVTERLAMENIISPVKEIIGEIY